MMTSNPIAQFTEAVLYVLDYLVEGEKKRTILQPVDAEYGVILEETSDGSDLMRGLLANGKRIFVPMSQVLHVEEWKVQVKAGYLGSGSRTLHLNEKQMERLVNNFPRDQETGEVKGIANFEKVERDKKE
ncbi:MAG: hypothetical protein SFY66_18645 [Oculatellaceae cyanobacterium bins.114]|nr:hypothetical protein [Oculatellaceae cyanobacterium bins.114]